MSSPDMLNWGPVTDPLPKLPSWASAPWTWAPGVVQRGSTYLMYYAAHDTAANQQCISVATSWSPSGPFTDNSAASFICQHALGGSIDPQPCVAPAGSLYLLWKSDNIAIGQPTALWAQQLSRSGRYRVGSAVKLLDMMPQPSWQGQQLRRAGDGLPRRFLLLVLRRQRLGQRRCGNRLRNLRWPPRPLHQSVRRRSLARQPLRRSRPQWPGGFRRYRRHASSGLPRLDRRHRLPGR